MTTDPITIEVVRNELEALMAEALATIRRTARAAMAKAGDISFQLMDADGEMVAVGKQTVVSALFSLIAKTVIRGAPDMTEGDAFIMNDPYSGGTHLPDVFMIRPIFSKGRRVAIAACYSHHSDVGGRFPGSQTGRSESIFEEGIRMPLLKIEAGGVRNTELLRLAAANVRPGEEFIGDVEAKLAGLRKADSSIRQILDRYGLAALQDCFRFMDERTTNEFRSVLCEALPGRYSAEAYLYDDGRGPVDTPITVRMRMDIGPAGIVADFDGSDPQVAGGINMTYANTYGIVQNVVRELMIPTMKHSGGFQKLVTVRAPASSIVNPTFPAAVAGRAPVFLVVDELVHLCLAQAMPNKVPALREAWDVLHFSKRTNDAQLSLMDLFSGGWGGRPEGDGFDGVAPGPTTTIGAEILEREYPLVVEGFGLVPDTSGAGRHRGSMAVFRRYRFLEEASIMVRTTKLRPSSGVDGGRPGTPAKGRAVLNGVERIMGDRNYDHLKVGPGDRYYHQTAGAGGLGDPLQREPEAVLKDVIEERVSVEAAARVYGVGINGSPPRIDAEATRNLRAERRHQAGTGRQKVGQAK